MKLGLVIKMDVLRIVRAHINEDSRKFNLENKILFECDFAKKNGLRPMGNSELLVQIFMKSKKRSMPLDARRVKIPDESRRERRHASARARRRKHTLAFGRPG